MKTFKEDLDTAVKYHGHLCSGQILGVRMARYGLEKMGLLERDPAKMRDLLVFVESDRCAADAAYAVTGATLGRRRMKHINYGKLAMSFYYIPTKEAVRVYPINNDYPPEGADLVDFWSKYKDEDLFASQKIEIDISENDLPGKPRRKVKCARCGETVLDAKDVEINGESLCKACAEGAYYRTV